MLYAFVMFYFLELHLPTPFFTIFKMIRAGHINCSLVDKGKWNQLVLVYFIT